MDEDWDNVEVLAPLSRSSSRGSSRAASPTRDHSPSRDPSQPLVLISRSPMSTGSFEGFGRSSSKIISYVFPL